MPDTIHHRPRRLARILRRRQKTPTTTAAIAPSSRGAAVSSPPAVPAPPTTVAPPPAAPGTARPAGSAPPARRRPEIQNRIVGIIGRKGSGKSTKLRELLRHCARWVSFDPMSDHAALAGGNVFETIPALARFLRWSREQSAFAGVYVPQGDPAEEIEEAASLVYARGNLCFVCEEVPLYTQACYIPPLFCRLIRTGRHRHVDVGWTAQRAAEVPKTLTSLTDVWVLFSQTEPKDLAALAERCGRDVADRVAALGPHDFLLWDAVGRRYLADSPRLLRQDDARPDVNDPRP